MFAGLTSTAKTPTLSAEAGQPEAAGTGFHIPFLVRNEGKASAASVIVEAVILAKTRAEQRSKVTLDYVPAQSKTKGGFVLTQDPPGSPVHVRVLGY